MKLKFSVLNKDSDYINFLDACNNIRLAPWAVKKANMGYFEDVLKPKVLYDYDKIAYNDPLKTAKGCFCFARVFLNNLYETYADDGMSEKEFEQAFLILLKDHAARSCTKPTDNTEPDHNFSDEEKPIYAEKMNKYLHAVIGASGLKESKIIFIKTLLNMNEGQFYNFANAMDKIINDKVKKYPHNTFENTLSDYFSIYFRNQGFATKIHPLTQDIKVFEDRINGVEKGYENMPSILHALRFLENDLMLSDENLAFDGFMFYNMEKKYFVTPNKSPKNKVNMLRVNRENQTNIALDETFAKLLIAQPKKHIKTNEVNYKFNIFEDKQTKKNIVSKVLFEGTILPDEKLSSTPVFPILCYLPKGFFCKVKEENMDTGTYSFTLYYFCDEKCQKPIQLVRLDKVSKKFHNKDACHIQRGKEKIYSTLHIHQYNLADSVLKNYTSDNDLGRMDIAYNFRQDSAFNISDAELIFDDFCGITNTLNRERHINEYEEFKKEFLGGKYWQMRSQANKQEDIQEQER